MGAMFFLPAMNLMKGEKSHGVKNVNDLLLQSEYADIIIGLLKKPYDVDSVVKIVFLSFCVRNESRPSYRKRKTDFVDAMLDNLNVKLLSHPNELRCIFEILNKLKKCGWICIQGGRIRILKDLGILRYENKFLVGCRGQDPNPIVEVNRLDDKAFIEEVLRHV